MVGGGMGGGGTFYVLCTFKVKVDNKMLVVITVDFWDHFTYLFCFPLKICE